MPRILKDPRTPYQLTRAVNYQRRKIRQEISALIALTPKAKALLFFFSFSLGIWTKEAYNTSIIDLDGTIKKKGAFTKKGVRSQTVHVDRNRHKLYGKRGRPPEDPDYERLL